MPAKEMTVKRYIESIEEQSDALESNFHTLAFYTFLSSFQGASLERLVMMAKGTHAFPSRTRLLSPSAPMVLGPQGPGRVGRCQARRKPIAYAVGFFCCAEDVVLMHGDCVELRR